MPNVVKMDEFVMRTLRAFLEAQKDAYIQSMEGDDPNVAETQAIYETATLALGVVGRFVAGLDNKAVEVPGKLGEAMEAFHSATCDHGEDVLRSKGYKPEEF